MISLKKADSTVEAFYIDRDNNIKPVTDKTNPGEGLKCPWPPLIRMNEEDRRKIDSFFGKAGQ